MKSKICLYSWDKVLGSELDKGYFINLLSFLEDERSKYEVYPNECDVFNAFKNTNYDDVRVVIFGQDPYHEPNEANGLAFSVNENVMLPQSLRNIYKEIEREYRVTFEKNGDLSLWAKQGVLLLNSVLTVRAHCANSHKDKGWEIFTDKVIEILNKEKEKIIFVLWGNNARKKAKLIDLSRHFVLEAPHPSPLSCYRGFFGCNHFKEINKILTRSGYEEIKWFS